ncbi:MAG: GDSL-type esterase/lipase family protein [Acidimicrobiia bacterium]
MNAWKILRPPVVAGTLLAGQMARDIFRDDLPSLDNQDPSGLFGDPNSPPLRLVFLGDSSVTSPGVEPLDHSWPRQMAIHLASRYRVEAISVASGGSKVRDVLDEQVDAALEARPDIAYLVVGSNDALRGTPVARFESDFNRIVSELYDSVPAIGLSGIGDLGAIPRLPELARGVARVRARAIDRAVARVAARYPRTVKSNAWDVMASFARDPALFADDLFHASAAGHLAFARVGAPMADRLVEILEESRDRGLLRRFGTDSCRFLRQSPED